MAKPSAPVEATAAGDSGAASDREVVIRRLIDAPRELVFEAWTNPKHLAAWWGPRGLESDCELDPRTGGAFRITMNAPDGTRYPMKGVYLEVTRPERLVYTYDLSGHPPEWTAALNAHRGRATPLETHTVTVTFKNAGKKTDLEIRTRFESSEVRDAFVKMGMNGGWGQSLDKLETQLCAERSMVIESVVNAPMALVWQVWTDPKHLLKWWGPDQLTNTIREIEVLAPSTTAYQPARLVYRHGTEDADDPGQFQSTITFDAFDDLGAEKTRVIMRGTFLTRAAYEAAKPNAVPGGQQAIAKMAAQAESLASVRHAH